MTQSQTRRPTQGSRAAVVGSAPGSVYGHTGGYSDELSIEFEPTGRRPRVGGGTGGPRRPGGAGAPAPSRVRDPLWARLMIMFGALLMLLSGGMIVGGKFLLYQATSGVE